MRKLSIDDIVYYFEDGRVKKVKSMALEKKWYSGIFESHESIVYEIGGEEFKDEDVFVRKSDAVIKMIEVLDFGKSITYDKIKKVCKYLFPEEWEDSIDDEDFKTLDIEESKNLIEAWGRV